MNAKAALERAEASGDEMALAAAHSELAEVNEGAVVAQAKAILAVWVLRKPTAAANFTTSRAAGATVFSSPVH